MRRLIIGIGIFIVVVIAALFIFAATFDVNKYRGTIQTQLEKRLGRQVQLGDMHLKVFPPRFQVNNLAISEDPKFSADAPFVKAQQLDVSPKLLPLLHREVEISSLNLERPNVNLIKNNAGIWNFSTLGENNPETPPSPQPKGDDGKPPAAQKPEGNNPPSSQQQFSLGELTIRDGQLSVLDQKTSKTPSLYDHIDITLKNYSPNTPFDVTAAVHMAGSGTQEVRLQGRGGPIVNGLPETTPFQGTLSLKQVNLADLLKFANSPATQGTDGVISGDTKINSASGKLNAQGNTQIQNAKIQGMELGFPINAQYDLTDDLAVQMLTIRDLVLKLGNTPVQMSGTVNAQPTPALLDVNVRANNVSIAEAAKLAASAGMALSQGTTATGTVKANIQAKGPANKPALTGTVNGSNLQMSGKNIAQPILIPAMNLNLTPAQIVSNPFAITSGGTTMNTQFTLHNYTSGAPSVDATVRAPNAQLPAVLAIAKAYGVTALDKVSGEGTLNLNLRANGPVKSISGPEIMRALNGTVDLNFNNVKYSGANVTQELSKIGGFLNAVPSAQSAGGVTNISTMTGNILVKNGIAQTNNLKAALDVGNVGAVGTANLVDQTLNLRVTAVLSQNASQKVGGNGVGGFMQTALANNQGELVIPAQVTGTFANPRFSPDVQQIAQMKLKGLVPDLSNPASVGSALQNLLGGGPANQGTNKSQAPDQKNQQNPVQQFMDLFGKKKTNPPPQ